MWDGNLFYTEETNVILNDTPSPQSGVMAKAISEVIDDNESSLYTPNELKDLLIYRSVISSHFSISPFAVKISTLISPPLHIYFLIWSHLRMWIELCAHSLLLPPTLPFLLLPSLPTSFLSPSPSLYMCQLHELASATKDIITFLPPHTQNLLLYWDVFCWADETPSCCSAFYSSLSLTHMHYI